MADASSIHQAYFETEGLPPGLARVRSLVAHEGLSFSYQVDIDLELPVTEIDPSAFIGANGRALITGTDGGILRRFCGIITRVRECASRDKEHLFAVTIGSPLASLR